MTAVACSSAVKKPTYQSRMEEAFEHHKNLQGTFQHLSYLVNISLEALGKSTSLSSTELPPFLEKQYACYETMLKGQKVAEEALQKYRDILAQCNPPNVALNPARVEYMEGLGFDMSEYPALEVNLAQSSVKLQRIITNIEQLIEKTAIRIDALPATLDIAAPHARKQARKEPTYGDKVPDTLGGAKGYFLKGFNEYKNKSSSVSSTTTTTTTPIEY